MQLLLDAPFISTVPGRQENREIVTVIQNWKAIFTFVGPNLCKPFEEYYLIIFPEKELSLSLCATVEKKYIPSMNFLHTDSVTFLELLKAISKDGQHWVSIGS